MVKVSTGSKGFKSFSLVDPKVVNDFRTTWGPMAQLPCPHVPEQLNIQGVVLTGTLLKVPSMGNLG